MLKKVDSSQLKVGMYIHDLSCDWMTHPFVRNRFKIGSEDEIRKIINAGIHDVVIDSDKGLDVQDAPTLAKRKRPPNAKSSKSPPRRRCRPASRWEEMQRAVQIRHQASTLVRTVMQDVRLGKAIELDQVQPVVQNITESILRNPGALVGLLRIKTKDDYTFLHSVSVCTLLVAFCRSRNIPPEITHQAGLGGLLHDTGKALVPDKILNKPGPLTDEEFAIIKKHPEDGYNILRIAGDRPDSARYHAAPPRTARRQRLSEQAGQRRNQRAGADGGHCRRVRRDYRRPLLSQGHVGGRRAAQDL
jgi:HD-GYP domain-containing protein (c-di-GMP phosphodiesterase class II)